MKHSSRAVALASAVAALTFGATRTLAQQYDVTTTADSGPGSLRQALADASANPGDDIVSIQPGLGTIRPASPLIYGANPVGSNVTSIQGNGATIDFGGAPNGLVDDFGDGVTISDLTITGVGGSTSRDAAPVLSEGGPMVLNNVTIVGNRVTTDDGDAAGAVLSEGGSVVLNLVTMRDNHATDTDADAAGAALSEGGAMTLKDCVVENNSVDARGDCCGGVLSEGGFLDVADCTISKNSARSTGGDVGGGVQSEGGGSSLARLVVECNSAVGPGIANRDAAGGFLNQSNSGTVDLCTFTGNRASNASPGRASNAVLSDFALNLSNSTINDDDTDCTTVIPSFFLPRTLTLVVKKPSSDKDSLIGSGYVDDGGVAIDFTQPVKVTIGGWERTITLTPNKKATKFTFKDAQLNFVLTPNVRKASLGFFTIKIAKTPLGALIDATKPLEFHFNASNLTNAAGTVKLTKSKYRRGSKRGDILVPHVFPAHVIVKLGGDHKDSLTFRGGFASGGASPTALGTVRFSFGDQFTRTIAGSQFTKTKKGSTFTYKAKEADGTKISFSVDFERDFLKVDVSKGELGPLSSPTTDVVFDAGDGQGAYRNVIRLSPDKRGRRDY